MRGTWLALIAATAGCNSLAGIDDLVDHPCAQEVCPDTSVVVADAVGDTGEPEILGETEVPDTLAAETSEDSALPDPTDTAPPLDGGVCSGAPAPLVTIIPGSGGYAIAATETTRGQYAAFLAAAPTLAQPSACAWNTSFVPAGWTAPSASECTLPVAGVDWCDAWSYCKWSGRRLCGRIRGGTLDPSGVDVKDPARDEWHRVCTANGTTDYSYGPSHLSGVCVDDDYDGVATFNPTTDVPRGVGTASGCKGPAAPYASVFDVTGNVREWEDACDSDGSDAENECRTRGGAFNEPSLSCNTGTLFKRSDRPANVGIRCCATL